MNNQIQVQSIQNSELMQSSQTVEVDSQLFESMLDQQQPKQQKKTEAESNEYTVSSNNQSSEDEDRITKEEIVNLGPFLIEMIGQETELSSQLGLQVEDIEKAEETINKVLKSDSEVSSKELKVVNELVEHFKTNSKTEQSQPSTLVRDKDTDIKVQEPVFYQKQVLDSKHVHSEMSLDQKIPVQEQKELVGYLNQLNRTAFSDPKQMIDNTESSKGELLPEESDELPITKATANVEKPIESGKPHFINSSSSKVVEQLLSSQASNSTITNKLVTVTQTSQLVDLHEPTTEIIDLATKHIVASRQVSSSVVSHSDEPEQLNEPKTTITEIMNRSLSNTLSGSEQLDTTTTAHLVIEKKELDVIKSMITEKVQNPGKPETLKSTIQLTPETLGKVTVEIEMIDSKVVGRLIVATSEAKVFVEQQLKSQNLIQPGQALQLDKVEVSVMAIQNAFDVAFNFSDQQQSSHFAQPMKQKKGYVAKEDQETEALASDRTIPGRLNVMA